MKTRRVGARVSMILLPHHGPENSPWPDALTREQLADTIVYTLGQEGYAVKDIHVTWTRKA